MGLLQELKQRFLPQAAASSSLSSPDQWLIDAMVGSATASGIRISPLAALGVPTVYACVNTVSRSISSLPLKLYRRRRDGGKDLADDHPLYALLHDAPNGEMTSADFRRAVQANASLRNSGYAYVVRNGLGEVVELMPIQNTDIKPERDAATGELFYWLKGERTPKEKILHIRGFTLNGVSGLDTVSTAREAIALSVALQDHGARFFPNASTPSVVIEFPQQMDDKQLRAYAEAFDRHNQGNANAHKRLFLWGGAKVGARPTVNNQQGQFLEARVYQDKAICQIFGVPQIKAGITDAAHYNNVEQENQSFITDTIRPWCVQWEQSLNARLLNDRERRKYFFEFDLNGLLRGDHAARAAFYEKMLQNGLMSRNEARASENLNPVEGGDNFFVSQNVQLLDASGKPIQDAPNPVSPT